MYSTHSCALTESVQDISAFLCVDSAIPNLSTCSLGHSPAHPMPVV